MGRLPQVGVVVAAMASCGMACPRAVFGVVAYLEWAYKRRPADRVTFGGTLACQTDGPCEATQLQVQRSL